MRSHGAAKRRKELARQEKRREKQSVKNERKKEKAPENSTDAGDPDLAGIVPGPQPPPEP